MAAAVETRTCPHGIDAAMCGLCRAQREAGERAEAEAPGVHDCAGCGATFDGVPVRDENEVWYAGGRRERALPYCSVVCMDADDGRRGR